MSLQAWLSAFSFVFDPRSSPVVFSEVETDLIPFEQLDGFAASTFLLDAKITTPPPEKVMFVSRMGLPPVSSLTYGDRSLLCEGEG